jgi:hypothetical protein
MSLFSLLSSRRKDGVHSRKSIKRIYTNKRAEHIRASKELDRLLREIADIKGFSKRQASDFVAFEMRKMMKQNKKVLEDGFRFW